MVFVIPRCRHDNVRAVHKQAHSLQQAGYELVLVVKESEVDQYLGMKVVRAVAPFESVLRPILSFPTLLRQLLKLRADVYFLCNPGAIPLAITLKLLRRTTIYDTCENFSKRLQTRNDLPRWLLPTLAWLQLVAGMPAKKRGPEAQHQ